VSEIGISGQFTVSGTTFVQDVLKQLTAYVYRSGSRQARGGSPIYHGAPPRAVICLDSDDTPTWRTVATEFATV
jgi:hypothetical protein